MVKTPNADKYVEKLNHLHLAGGNVKQYSHSGKQLGNFFKKSLTKHAITSQPSYCIPGHLLQKSENICLHTSLHMNVPSSFICNNWQLETVHISFNRWMVENYNTEIIEYYSASSILAENHIFSATKRTNFWYHEWNNPISKS